MVFVNIASSQAAQGFIISEKQVLFEIENFTVREGIVSLISTYYAIYVKYPKPLPAQSFLLFVQAVLLEDLNIKCSAKYTYSQLNRPFTV